MTNWNVRRSGDGRAASKEPAAPQGAGIERPPAGFAPIDPAAYAQLDAGERLAHLQNLLSVDSAATVKAFAATESWRRRNAPEVEPEAAPPPAPAPAPVKVASASSTPRRLLKTALGLAVVAVVGYAPVQRLMQTSSVEAVVNARVITLRSPIEGEVQAGPSRWDVGAALAPGDVLFRVVDKRADHSRLADLNRQLEQFRDERPGLAARLASSRTLLNEVNEQTRQFTQGRILQLEAREEELEANAEAARAKNQDAAATLERATRLAGQGVMAATQATLAQRDARVAAEGEVAALKQIEAAKVELAAARNGVFVGDSYNDRPQSSQRADELQQQVVELEQSVAQYDRRIASLGAELKDETARYAELSAADIAAPAKGSVWEILTAPGEQVHRGQDLMRALDCSGALVTAVVSEAVYDRLQVGSPARFRPRDGGEDLPGRVISLTGSSGSPANFAIEPAALQREAYHVTVSVPDLVTGQGCGVGRTGRVIFDDDRLDILNILRPEFR